MDNFSKVKAEIERRIEDLGLSGSVWVARSELHELLSFIESLEKKDSVYFTDGEVSLGDASSDKEQSPKIRGWVARDECLCFFQGEKPFLTEETKLWDNTEYDPIYLDESLFPDIQLENSPVEVELIIHRV